ncbi:MAG TPA: threonine/serine dehydratase [Longimicrobiales bacterium]|nr:threonine/serine dehydratase [Longimicrobiales bacterium]
MVRFDDITAAAERIATRVHHTPLLSARTLGEPYGTNLFLKAECLQRTGSFKVRGALNRVDTLDDAARARGLIAVSAGNHAQAVAYAARATGTRCTVVMPATAPKAKIAATEAYGGTVVLHGTVGDAFRKMEELRGEHGFTLVHPFEDPVLMAGQGTVGIEIVQELPDVDAVIVPVGGGGLISGVAAAVRHMRPSARIIGVEPVGAAAVTAGLQAGGVQPLERVDTIADGLGAPMTGELVLEHVRTLVDEVVTVSDDAIASAMSAILARAKLLVEPAGAAGYAAIASGAIDVAGQTTVVILSGGNVDLDRVRELV